MKVLQCRGLFTAAFALLSIAALVAVSCSSGSDSGPESAESGETPEATGTSSQTATVPAATPLVSTSTPTAATSPTPTLQTAQQFGDVYDQDGVLISSPDIGPDGLLSEVVFDEDGVPHLIPPDKVEGGGVGRDGIPSIDRPHFVGPDRWDQMGYNDDWLVISVEANGKQRAYPFQIIVWHEIINDTFEGTPLLVTF